MSERDWQRRIDRAEELAARYASAAEILRFYAAVARFQGEFYREFGSQKRAASSLIHSDPFASGVDREVAGGFRRFLPIVERNGPGGLREAARQLGAQNEESHYQLLSAFWEGNGNAPAAEDFFARAYLQPYAAYVRERANLRWSGPTPYVCPFCKRKPCVGVLRPLGEGSQRSLICSLCLAEWEFRRIVCPGCGEEDPAKLPVYTAEELQHVRVEACDSCKSYIKTVDLTKSGLGEPVVDEIASVALDLWAQMRGYAKLQVNLLQL
jgi:formate dehydrogenase accessory protein FdhE